MEATVTNNNIGVEMDPGGRACGLQWWWRTTATVSIKKRILREQTVSDLEHKVCGFQ